MATSTVEDYVKRILLEQHEGGEAPIPMGRVATALGVVPGTTTTMMKALSDAGLVAYEPRVGVRLTEEGEKLATHVLRRHRLVELFLVEILGLDWSEIHAEAELLEHAVSDRVLDRIDKHLGYPTADPHGDPIPPRKGQFENKLLPNLSNCVLENPVRIVRISDQRAEFLAFLEGSELVPGMEVRVSQRNINADSVSILLAGGGTITLGSAAAEKILVEGI